MDSQRAAPDSPGPAPAALQSGVAGHGPRAAPALSPLLHLPWALYGLLLFSLGICVYLLGVSLVVPRYLLGLEHWLRPVAEWLVWYSGLPLVLGAGLVLGDMLVLRDRKRGTEAVHDHPVQRTNLVVVLTAYNDEDSIGPAVRDFLGHPGVGQVIVVSNNSTDRTALHAEAAGAVVVNEEQPGYGSCVYRCLSEALRRSSSDIIILCEGDGTFQAADIDKLLAYAPHADIVNGTRTVERLRQPLTQLSTFMYYGNVFVGKMLEFKHLGKTTITDVGTTYKLCHREALQRLLPALNPGINLEFNAHFLDAALANGLSIVECPITFHLRVGVSKGGNVNNGRALQVGLRMMRGIAFGWRKRVE